MTRKALLSPVRSPGKSSLTFAPTHFLRSCQARLQADPDKKMLDILRQMAEDRETIQALQKRVVELENSTEKIKTLVREIVREMTDPVEEE